MKRKRNGKNVHVDHSEATSIFPMKIMVVDSDEQSLQQNVTTLQKYSRLYEVTECDKIDQALTLLDTDGSEFHIILVGECLLATSKSKLLRIGNERDLPVLITSADDGIDTITRSIDDGASAYLPKPIPESVLKLVWTYGYSKRKTKFAQVPKQTNDASREKKPRLKWTKDLKKMFEKSVTELGIELFMELERTEVVLNDVREEHAKPSAILKRMETMGIQEIPITTAHISSYRQKYRKKLKKDEERTIEGSTLKIESSELPSLDSGIILEDSSLLSNKNFPAGTSENYAGDDDIAHGHSKSLLDSDVPTMTMVDDDHGHSNSLLESPVLEMMTGDNNIADGHWNSIIDSQVLMMNAIGTIPSHTSGYKDKEGTTSSEQVESRYVMEENPPRTLPPHLNTTNPNQRGFNLPLPVEVNTSCTIGGQLFINDLPDNLFDGLPIVHIGDILDDPSLSLPIESGPVGIFENNNGNDIAHENSNNLVVDDNNFLVVNNYFLADDVEKMPLDANLPES